MVASLMPVSSVAVGEDRSLLSSSDRTEKPDLLEPLTSLRFFAAAAIIMLHFSSMLCPETWRVVKHLSLDQGVSFFYVLSGFVQTYVYPKLVGFNSVLKFWRARFARIYPAHIVGLTLVMLLKPPTYAKSLFGKLLACNLLLIQDWFPFRRFYWSFNNPAWSISCELFFYLCFPLLLHNFARTRFIKLAVVLAVAAGFISMTCLFKMPDQPGLYSLSPAWFTALAPPTRLPEFLIGMLTAVVFAGRQKGGQQRRFSFTILEISLVIAAFLFLLVRFPAEAVVSLFSVPKGFQEWFISCGGAPLYAGLIYVFACKQGKISKFISSPGFIYLGEISFSMYLVHFSVLGFLARNLAIMHDVYRWLFYPCCWLFILAASCLSYELVEKPCRGIILGKKPRVVVPKMNSAVAASALVVSILSVATLMHNR
jgi:peptidoglycan/LPS O-acetylase OafA/YrhL